MGRLRAELLQYLATLPFFVRSRAGLSIAHAGVGAAMLAPAGWQTLRHLDHEYQWQKVAQQLSRDMRIQLRNQINRIYPQGYDGLNADSWNVHHRDDQFYDDILIALTIQNATLGQLLWNSFFTQNEREYGSAYPEMVQRFLQLLSTEFVQQKVLISGHIGCDNGYTLVSKHQLRLASAAHSRPPGEGKDIADRFG